MRFAAKSAHLRQAGDARFHETAHVIVRHQLGELLVMFDQMRPRSDDAHVAAQHVPKLRHFIEAQFAQPFSDRINAFVVVFGPGALDRSGRAASCGICKYRSAILNSGARLDVKKRAGRLQPLRDPDKQRQGRKNENHDRNGNGEIDCAFEKTVERIFQRFFAQSDEAKAVVFEMRDRMAQFFFQIAHDEKPNAELIAKADQMSGATR